MELALMIIVLIVATINTLIVYYHLKHTDELLNAKINANKYLFGKAMKTVDENFNGFQEEIDKIAKRHGLEDQSKAILESILKGQYDKKEKRISVPSKRKPISPQARKNMSDSLKKYWANKHKEEKKAKKSNKK